MYDTVQLLYIFIYMYMYMYLLAYILYRNSAYQQSCTDD